MFLVRCMLGSNSLQGSRGCVSRWRVFGGSQGGRHFVMVVLLFL